MEIYLTPEQEKIIQEELKSGQFRTVKEVIDEALSVFREKQRSAKAAATNSRQREAVQDMRAFVEKNRVRLDGISVKDLIHEGHRL